MKKIYKKWLVIFLTSFFVVLTIGLIMWFSNNNVGYRTDNLKLSKLSQDMLDNMAAEGYDYIKQSTGMDETSDTEDIININKLSKGSVVEEYFGKDDKILEEPLKRQECLIKGACSESASRSLNGNKSNDVSLTHNKGDNNNMKSQNNYEGFSGRDNMFGYFASLYGGGVGFEDNNPDDIEMLNMVNGELDGTDELDDSGEPPLDEDTGKGMGEYVGKDLPLDNPFTSDEPFILTADGGVLDNPVSSGDLPSVMPEFSTDTGAVPLPSSDTDTNPVPEPSTFLLMGSAIVLIIICFNITGDRNV